MPIFAHILLCISACLSFALPQQFQMHSFRVKPSSSQPSRHSKTPEPNAQGYFPFSNKKLRVSGWEQEALTIRRFKSNTQISRRNYEFIPNLKTLKLDNEKVAIVKSAKNQYNIFMRRSEGGRSRTGMECINGVKTQDEREAELFCNSKLVGVNRTNAHRSSLIFGSRSERSDFAASYSGTIPLQISGQIKCLSPSRSGTRAKNMHGDDRIIML